MRGRVIDNLQNQEFLIFANGSSDNKFLKDIQKLALTRKIIALDGAADKLYELYDIIPDVIIGDFDSINMARWNIIKNYSDENPEPYIIEFCNKEVLIVPVKNQDLTDLEKAILFCDKFNSPDILIINAIGDRIDHSLGNIRTLRKYYSPSRRLFMRTTQQTLEVISNNTKNESRIFYIQGNIGDYCGIMAFPEAVITTEGLLYDVQNYQLTFAHNDSTCNSLKKNKAKIEILKGYALLIYSNQKL